MLNCIYSANIYWGFPVWGLQVLMENRVVFYTPCLRCVSYIQVEWSGRQLDLPAGSLGEKPGVEIELTFKGVIRASGVHSGG